MLDVWLGKPYPLGATWDGQGVNFALFSENAEKVELCLFDPKGEVETERITLVEQTDQIWHAYFPDLRPGQFNRKQYVVFESLLLVKRTFSPSRHRSPARGRVA